MSEELNLYGLVNKPPIDEIFNLDLVNKPPLVTSDDELAHYGILGMRWGIRRYQNPDGTLTDIGKKRLAKHRAKEEKRAVKAAKKREKYIMNPDSKYIRKHFEKFDIDEIKKAYERMDWKKKIEDIDKDRKKIGKEKIDTMIKYGDSLNNVVSFLNSDAGKGIRQKLGLSTKDIFDFSKKEKKAEERQKDIDSFNDWKKREWEKKKLGVDIEKYKEDQYKKWGWDSNDKSKNNKSDNSSLDDDDLKAFFESEAGQSAFEDWKDEEEKKKKKK